MSAPSVYRIEKPKARKEHKCYECQGVIAVGEVYHYHSGIWDGEAARFKVCVDCEALRCEVDKGETDSEWLTPFGNLYESVFDRGSLDQMRRYVALKERRGADIQDWMKERIRKNEEATRA